MVITRTYASYGLEVLTLLFASIPKPAASSQTSRAVEAEPLGRPVQCRQWKHCICNVTLSRLRLTTVLKRRTGPREQNTTATTRRHSKAVPSPSRICHRRSGAKFTRTSSATCALSSSLPPPRKQATPPRSQHHSLPNQHIPPPDHLHRTQLHWDHQLMRQRPQKHCRRRCCHLRGRTLAVLRACFVLPSRPTSRDPFQGYCVQRRLRRLNVAALPRHEIPSPCRCQALWSRACRP